MTEINYFHPGQFFTKRSLISVLVGIPLIGAIEFLFPFFGIHTMIHQMIPDFSTASMLMFTLAIMIIVSVTAKNIIASVLFAVSGSLAYYNPYESFGFGYLAIITIYFVTALLTGMFASIRLSGQNALRTVGIMMGLQTLIGASLAIFVSMNEGYARFYLRPNTRNIAIGTPQGELPLFEIIVIAGALIYMAVFLVLARKSHTFGERKKHLEITGHLLIFIALIGILALNLLTSKFFGYNDAVIVLGEDSAKFMNVVFLRSLVSNLMVTETLVTFFALPLAGLLIGLGLALIIFGRAESTTEKKCFNFEGAFITLNIVPALLTVIYSGIWFDWGIASSYLSMEAWYIVFIEFTNLLLVNLILVFIIGKILTPLLKLNKD